MKTDVRGATNISIAWRRHDVMSDGGPCPGCGQKGVFEMLGIGVASGGMTCEEMAQAHCTQEGDFIETFPVNVTFPDLPMALRRQAAQSEAATAVTEESVADARPTGEDNLRTS